MDIGSKTIRILHLEDEKTDAALTARLLKKKGVDAIIKVVDKKLDFEESIDSFSPDIILSDHSLPSFGSREALEILQFKKPEVPFILLSGALDSETAVDLLKKGAKDFLLKDRPERLDVAIKQAIHNAELEKEKKENNYKFRKLIESSEDVFCIISEDGKIEYISPSGKELLDLDDSYDTPTHICEIINDEEEDIPEFLGNFKGLEEGASLKKIFKHKAKKRELKWLDCQFTNLLRDPVINGIRVYIRDITRKRETELRIKESEKKYRAFFDNSLDGILLTSVDGQVHAANPAACKIFQMTEEEICQKGRKGLVDQNDPNLKKALKQRKETGKVLSVMRMIRKDGTSFPAELSSSVYTTDERGIAKTAMVIRDVTEKKRFEKELERSKERYKDLFQLNPLPVFLFNENTLDIVDVNKRTTEHYGFSREELQQMNLRDIRPKEDLKDLQKIMQDVKQKRQELLFAYVRHLKKNGTVMEVEINSHRIYIDGEPHILAVCNDVTEKNRNLEKIRESSKKLKMAEKIAKLGYWEFDVHTKTSYCSKMVYDIFGIKGKNGIAPLEMFTQRIHPDDLETFNEALSRAIDETEPFAVEYRIVMDDGSIKWLQGKGKLKKDRLKRPELLKGVLLDITAQKKNVQEIIKSEARYKGLVQSQTNYFVRIGLDGNYSFCNDKFIEEFGWMFPDNNPVGHDSLTDIAEYHKDHVRSVAMKCFANPNESIQAEIHKRVKDYRTKATLWDMVYLPEAGENGEMQCTGIDISARVEAERQNEFQANLLDKIGQGIIATDVKGKAIYWNRAAEKLYGWKQEEILNKKVHDLLHPESQSFPEISKLLKSGKTWNSETKAVRKDKSSIPIQITASPINIKENEFKGSVIISSDLTELKKSELKLKKLNKELKLYTKELVQANKGLEQFSYIVSHNLRAPVANILGLADILQDEESEEIKEKLYKELINNVGRLDMVIKDLNSILELKNELHRRKENVNLKRLIHNISSGIENLIKENEVEFHLDLEEINEFKTVKTYLYSILYNLISNSIKYSKPETSPEISIKSGHLDNYVIIKIEDNGLGMDLSKRKDHIFGLYKRYHNHVDGKGMGLFMVKTQVELLGGEIDVKSNPGIGTTFTIKLPHN